MAVASALVTLGIEYYYVLDLDIKNIASFFSRQPFIKSLFFQEILVNQVMNILQNNPWTTLKLIEKAVKEIVDRLELISKIIH